MIQAIETMYRGCKFRSRLEARWAIFFDALGIKWEYEKEGYIVGGFGRKDDGTREGGTPYLPDFYLPDLGTWVEVKGAASLLNYQLMADSVEFNAGLPGTYESLGTSRGLLLLGPLPFVSETMPLLPIHPILQHSSGGWLRSVQFWNQGFRLYSWPDNYFDATWSVKNPPWDSGDYYSEWMVSISKFFAGERGYKFPTEQQRQANLVKRAYTAARSARFEHGANPQPRRPA